MSGWDKFDDEPLDTDELEAKYAARPERWKATTAASITAVSMGVGIALIFLTPDSTSWHVIGWLACLLSTAGISWYVKEKQAIRPAPIWFVICCNIIATAVAMLHASTVLRRLL